MFKKYLIILAIGMAIVGCSVDKNATTDLREYNIDGYLTVVGVGQWDDGMFRIKDYRGQPWDIPATAEILEGPITLQSFERTTK